MVASNLGKRARCSTDDYGKHRFCPGRRNLVKERFVLIRSCFILPDSQGVLTRAKRRARLVLGYDENDDPFTTGRRTVTKRNDDGIDEPIAATRKAKQPAGCRSVPTKRVAPENRAILSPSRSATKRKYKAQLVDIFNDTDVQTPPTPETPRHRDVLPKRVFVTPKHRISSAAKPLTPRTPHTPSTPTASRYTAVYNDARQLFARSRQPDALVCREHEKEELSSFINERVEGRKSGCIYVSGPPGTGKSALVRDACNRLSGRENLRATDVNCMCVRTAKDLCTKLLSDFDDDVQFAEGEEARALEKLLFKRGGNFLVVLDEIDHFLDVDLDMLYTLFEYALDPESSLILVGIANALDFTDRFLPRLKAKGLKPDLLPVMSYTSEQIATVITTKLSALMPIGKTDFVPFIHPTAVNFLAKKISAQSGDLRKAFDICRSAIDLIEVETKMKQTSSVTTPDRSPSKTPLMENINLSSPPTARSSPKKKVKSCNGTTKTNAISTATINTPLTVESAPRVTISHMARVTAKVLSNGSSQRLAVLNLQQKAALCALTALEKKNRLANDPFSSSISKASASSNIPSSPTKRPSDLHAPTTRSLYNAYSILCTHDNLLHPLTSTEFRDVIGSLDNLGLIVYVDRSGRTSSAAFGAEADLGGGGGMTPSRSGSGKGRGRKPAFGFTATVAEDRKVATAVSESELIASLVGSGSEILKELLDGRALLC